MSLEKFSLKKPNDLLFFVGGIGVLSGLALAIVSWLRLCSEDCAATHNWRFFGFEFEKLGLIFFFLLPVLYLFSRKYRVSALLAGAMVAGALGTEIMLILVQKYKIGHWCPVCLSIAAAIGTVALCMAAGYFIDLNTILKKGKKDELMKKVLTGMSSLAVVLVGFLLAFIGVAKIDNLHAEENSIAKSIAFGNTKSPIEVYIITDWFCPACRSLEPTIEKATPDIEKLAKVYFVDLAVHEDSLNFTPYNLSFMINDKSNYLKLRSVLHDISKKIMRLQMKILKKLLSLLA